MMKVAFDGQIFGRQRVGGISRGHSQLLSHFDALPSLGVDAQREFGWHRNLHLGSHAGPIRRAAQGSLLDHSRVVEFLNLRHAATLIRRTSVPLHGTFYSRVVEAACGRRPVVVTLYDMIPEMPEFHSPRSSHLNKLSLIAKADLVVAISQTAADQLLRSGAPHGHLVVCTWGVDASPETSPAPADHPEFRMLYVGPRGGYKNFGILLSALRRIRLERPAVLTAVGGGMWTLEERARINALSHSIEVRQVDVGDSGLVAEYRASDLFVSTSLVEGFGLPPLEAMSAGLPVLCSDIEAHREIAGPAARMFNPSSADLLAAAIEELSRDPNERSRLRAEGVLRAQRFDWRATSAAYAAAYATL